MPVCSSDRAWRFGCVHPGLLAYVDGPSGDELDAECSLFWTVLGAGLPGGLASTPLGQLAQGRRRVHVLPALCLVDKLFPGLDAALAHPHTFHSVHVSEKGPGTPAKRVKAALGAGAVLAILSSADGRLVLPGAWVLQRTTKGSGIRGLSRVCAWLVRHSLEADGPAVLAVGARLRAFLLAATPAGVSASTRAGHLSPKLRSILGGRHWLLPTNGCRRGSLV